jgi:4-amino-4-deoxy-L-arabinose transferase-like glycosyltransferase
MSLVTRLIERPERALVALMGAQVAFWTLAPAFSHTAPPLDVVEMYAWGREGVVATFKHPNLPGLVLEASRQLTGIAGWPAYLISQLFIVNTFWAVFALGREMMGAPRALAGVLMLTGVYFFSWTTPEFNHNVAQMPLWALVSLFLWRAGTHGGLLNWALLGLFAGLSLWAKYSSVMVLAPAALWLLWDADARKRLLSIGPWLALIVFAVIATPQALWLMQHDFQPFHYAARRSGDGGPLAALEFVLTEIANHLPMLILIAAAGYFGEAAPDAPPKPEQRALRFLLLIGLGPLVLTALAGIFGAGLRASWGMPMFNLSGLIVVALLSSKFSVARLGRLAWGASVLIVLVSGLYFAHMRYGARFTDDPLRGNWPQARLSAALQDAWAEETGGAPLRIVSGDIWTAGLVGMSDPNPPSVLINGDRTISPWITSQEYARYGALIVWTEEPNNTRTADGHVTLRYPLFPNAPPLRIAYAITPPGPAEDPPAPPHN